MAAEITELTDEVTTVADEILMEVKLCRERQEQLTLDLALLREGDVEHRAQREALLTEIQNLREESRNLNAELKALLSQQRPSESLTPLTSPSIVEVEPEIISPVEEEGPVALPTKKKKRYRI